MNASDLSKRAESYLHHLCVELPNRRVGSEGNRRAAQFAAAAAESFGFTAECADFPCIDWVEHGVTLVAGDARFEAFASPYSLGCEVAAPLVVVSSGEDLEAADFTGKVLLIRGGLAAEPIMPKHFPFYNPEEHQRFIAQLESGNPAAIIAATSRSPEMAGGLYPFPLIEDGDFDIPSAYMTEEEGQRLAVQEGEEVAIRIDAERIPSTASNMVARMGSTDRRVVVSAHIDSKINTPGALDNAAGVTVLLLLMELLQTETLPIGVEIVAFNGEDYFSSPGQIAYLRENAGKLEQMLLNVNIDGAGFHQGGIAYSLYECPDALAGLIREAFRAHRGLVEGEPWVQGDHMVFVQNGVPALAITSERVMDVIGVTHTPADTPELVDSSRLVETAVALRDLVMAIGAL